jgi:hypothetical protein
MKIYFTILLAALITASISFAQNNAPIQANDSRFLSNQYDSSYDFSQIRSRNRNPKDLIGQELEFDQPDLML